MHNWFKSYGHFSEGVDFAYWWSCIRKDLRLQPSQQACFYLAAFTQYFVSSWLVWSALRNVCSCLVNVCIQPNNQPPSFFLLLYRSICHVLIWSLEKHPAAQATGTDPTQCNSTNRQNLPLHQNSPNLLISETILMLFEI